MNHTFQPSIQDNELCRVCTFDLESHTDQAECESCGNKAECDVKFGNILMCKVCGDRDDALRNDVKKEEEKLRAVNAHATIERARVIDDNIQVVSDIHNSQTVTIKELKDSFEADDSIPEGQREWKLAQFLDTRYKHLTSLIAKRNAENQKDSVERANIQLYYNKLARKLRDEERAKISIQDINYTPKEPEKIKQPKAPRTKTYDKAELIRFSNDMIREFPATASTAMSSILALHQSMHIPIEAAYNILRGTMAAQRDKDKAS